MVKYMSVIACLFMMIISNCMAKDYTVGEAAGWTIGVDYSSWSTANTFNVGDKLVFKYSRKHTVDEVNSEDYTSCTLGNSISSHKSGSTKITLKTPGTHYFICAVPDHCTSGMKFAITVSATPTPPCTGSTITPPAIHLPPPGNNPGGSVIPAPPTPTYGVAPPYQPKKSGGTLAGLSNVSPFIEVLLLAFVLL